MREKFETIGLLTARASNGPGYSIEVHRSSGCELNVLHRRWHVLSYYPSQQLVLRSGCHHNSRLVQDAGHVGIYPAGSSERVIWKGCVEGLHLHIDPRTIKDDRGHVVDVTRADDGDPPELGPLLSALYEEVRSIRRTNLAQETDLIQQIRAVLTKRPPRKRTIRSLPKIGSILVSEVLDAMHGPNAVQSNLGSIAKFCGISDSEFSRQFRRTIGSSPHDYLIRSRIEQGKHAIYSGGSNLSQIALENGFYDQAHFTKTFRKRIGLTPTEYMHWFDR